MIYINCMTRDHPQNDFVFRKYLVSLYDRSALAYFSDHPVLYLCNLSDKKTNFTQAQ